MSLRLQTIAVATVCCASLFAARLQADPLAGEQLKFIQMPLNGGLQVPITLPPGSVAGTPAPYPGHDEFSTAYSTGNGPQTLSGTFMADDFSDNFNTPVVHVQWWGSYLNQAAGINPATQFLVTFEGDVPADPLTGSFSHPGQPLLSQVVMKAAALSSGSGTFTETPVPVPTTSPEGNLFQYNAELALPFQEKAGTVYWLKIVALDPTHTSPTQPGAVQWGWHDRDWGVKDLLASPIPLPGETDEAPAGLMGPVWHFQDDAVSGIVDVTLPSTGGLPIVGQSSFAPQNYIDFVDGPQGIGNLSKDLAFALYTTPEPSTFVLVAIGLLALVLSRRRWQAVC